jgi:DNA-binding XRE family transcriptional regulator
MGSAANRTRTEIREHVCWGCERNPSTEAPKPVGVFRTLNVGGGKVAHTTMQQCRFNAGLTMIDVAEILHIDPRIYSQYERGERIPARGHILKLIKLFGLPWEELKQ